MTTISLVKVVKSAATVAAVSLAFTVAPAIGVHVFPATTAHAVIPVTEMSYWYTPHSHYFKSKSTCQAYGAGATGDGYVPGMTSYYCYQNPGQSKWSIDLFYSDGG